MSEIEVSLIIAVYNREDTLERCINSALKQTVDEMEIIVVDDGSTDRSVSIIEKYIEDYENITLIKCAENGGAGRAKNIGVQKARGKYVGFLDSDDYLDPDYLEKLLEAIKRTQSDMAIADICLEKGTTSTVCRIHEGNLVVSVKGLSSLSADLPSIIPGIIISGFWGASSCCTKLVKRENILKYPFYEGRRCDDLPVALLLIAQAKQIVYVPQCIYHYVASTGSLERTQTSENQLNAVKAIKEVLLRYEENNVDLEYEKILVAISLFPVISDLIEANDLLEREDCIYSLHKLLNKIIHKESLDETKNPYLAMLSSFSLSPEKRKAIQLLPYLAESDVQNFVDGILEWRKSEEGFHPKVSIIIPVYNGANYMREAIDSALAQTYNNIEIIVINDGSKDDGETDKIARSYGDKIRYIEKPNGGVATALNLGIEKMTGEYFSWLSHDDMYTPNKIEEEIRWLKLQSDKTTIIAEGYQIVNANGEFISTVNLYNLYSADRLKNSMFLVLRGGINGCALLIHKSHFKRVGLFDPSLPTTQDYDLWFRMFREGKVHYINSANVLSRCHDEQGSKAMLSSHVQECNKLWIGMLDQLSKEERVAISGSEYNYYREAWEFLKTSTGYQGAIKYAECMMYHKAIEEYESNQSHKLLRNICRWASCLEKEMLNTILPLRKETGNKHKRRIMFYLGGRYEISGLNRAVLQVAGLLSEKYDVIITTCQEPSDEGYPTPRGVTEIKILQEDINIGFGVQLNYMAYLLNVELLVVSYNCVEKMLYIYENAKYFGIRTIAWNHEFYMLPYWTPSLRSCVLHRNNDLRKADAVVWLNSASARIYQSFGENGVVIPNANPYTDKKRIDGKFLENLVAVGRFDDPRKGLEDLLRMFAVVLKSRSETELFVVGAYSLDATLPSNGNMTYRQLIEQLQISEDALHFVGQVSDVDEYYLKGCIHVLPSRNEGFGLVVLEAATMGLPSVVYTGSGMDDIITDGVDGIKVAQGDYQALADSVLRLLENSEEREKMSLAAQEMTKRYAPERIRDMWSCLIDAVLEKGKRDEGTCLSDCGQPYGNDENSDRQAIREYERLIMTLLRNQNLMVTTSSAEQAVISDNPDLFWQEECLRMQQCFSWRVTKPLRLVRKGMTVLQTQGLRVFLKKVWNKLFIR